MKESETHGVKHGAEDLARTVEPDVHGGERHRAHRGEYEESYPRPLRARIPRMRLVLILERVDAEPQLRRCQDEHDAK